MIQSLEGPEGTVTSTEEIHKIANNYYKDLFKFEERPDMNLAEKNFLGGR